MRPSAMRHARSTTEGHFAPFLFHTDILRIPRRFHSLQFDFTIDTVLIEFGEPGKLQ